MIFYVDTEGWCGAEDTTHKLESSLELIDIESEEYLIIDIDGNIYGYIQSKRHYYGYKLVKSGNINKSLASILFNQKVGSKLNESNLELIRKYSTKRLVS